MKDDTSQAILFGVATGSISASGFCALLGKWDPAQYFVLLTIALVQIGRAE